MPVGLQGRAQGGADQPARTGDGYVHRAAPSCRSIVRSRLVGAVAASVGRRMSTRMLLVLALLCGMAILLSFTVLVLTV